MKRSSRTSELDHRRLIEREHSVACDDGIDNDGDGRKDYDKKAGAGDAQCTSATDNSEAT